MSLLGKVYLLVSLFLLGLGLVWTVITLNANAGWVEVTLYTPQLDLSGLLVRRRFEVSVAALLAGWIAAAALVAVSAIRAPFRIRGAAIAQRRTRELEREVLELRTLPLRQEEEDEILAAEAHLGRAREKVMLGVLDHSMVGPIGATVGSAGSTFGPGPRRTPPRSPAATPEPLQPEDL